MAWRGADADGLQQELAGLLRRRERLRRQLQGLQVFGEYLRGVVATTGRVSVTKGASPSRVPPGLCSSGATSTKSPPK